METKFNTPEPNTNGQGAGLKTTESKPVMSATGAKSGVSNEFHSFITDIEDLVQATTSLTGDDLARAKARLSARISAAKKSVEEMSAVIADRARNTVTATNGYVHEQPWQAIGIGAALGLLVGFVLARRG